jgi:hypothetical protein
MARPATTAMLIGAGAAVSFVATRQWTSPQARLARMSGSSIAAPDAAGWVTDFLNAAYYRRCPELRDVEDLRLAFSVVTTYWHRHGHRRLRAGDVVPFHRAYGRHRFVDGVRTPRGTLDHLQLLEGAGRLLGPWFGDAYADDARRGWGIAFETQAERAAYRPEERLRAARLGPLTPPTAPGREQVWHTYPPVEVSSADGVIAALSRPEAWPDYASEIGRFTPVRTGGLEGQAFEIEVAAGIAAGRPVFTRGYVTITRLVSGADADALGAYIAELNDGLARFGRDEPPAVPEGASPVLAFDLTTHEGHFMGSGRNRLVLFEEDCRAYVRAAGTWDPMPWHLEALYERAGRDAQHAFWGQDEIVDQSMLHQIAARVAAAAPR